MEWPELARATPRFFEAMAKRHKLNVDRSDRSRDFMLAQIASEVANSSGFPRYKEWRRPAEFLPRWQLSEDEKQEQRKGVRRPRMTKKRKEALAVQLRDTFMRFVEK